MPTPLEGIFQIFSQSEDFNNLCNSIEKETSTLKISGLSRSIKLLLLVTLNLRLKRPVVYIASNQHKITQFVDELRTSFETFFPNMEHIIFFPDYEGMDDPYTAAERLGFFSAVFEENKKSFPLIASSLKAFLRLIPSMSEVSFLSLDVSPGSVFPMEKLILKLLTMGYRRTDLVINPGEFTQRGGIIDLYPPTMLKPVRIEWWGDEVDEIREFEASTQRSLETLEILNIGPAREFICEFSLLEKGVNRIKKDLNYRISQLKKEKKVDEAEYLYEKYSARIQSLMEGNDYSLLLEYPHFFFQNLTTPFDYLPPNAIICLDEPEQLKEEIKFFLNGESEMNFFRSEQGLVLPRRGDIYMDWQEFFNSLSGFQSIELYMLDSSDSTMCFNCTPSERFRGQINLLIQSVQKWITEKQTLVILSRHASRISEMFSERGIEVLNTGFSPGKIMVFREQFPEGFSLTVNKLIVLTDMEIFGKSKIIPERKQKIRRHSSSTPVSLGDLNTGDCVVHEDYGIAKYEGIERLVIEGISRDFISLIFAKNDKLYIPVDQLYKVTRYIGGGDEGPKLSKLGTSEWKKAKKRVAKMVQDIAQELIKLYALRQTVEGYVFKEDSQWQKQMEESFIYEETADQKKAIGQVKRDMQSKVPMDRLICGDVGYGKTEVAIRAAFKAMEEGKQVLMLVPTTVLAQQHYNTFTDRLAPYPFKIEMLSRFRTPKEQKAIIQALRDGTVEMVIGTHRLLQKDISVADLGLLIIDEEQRFGVAHKEKLKKLRENVHVITLTATPIPRTLYMSLVGARDITVIETPPEDRLPVITYLIKRSDKIIKDAISRELARGGQVYYLHNNVETIDKEAFYLKSSFPEARIIIGHGQMDEGELEQVMLDFVSGEYDILVCTTIIESGLDIPNANTLIVNKAERFGLSQLYQLRGRVGRSTRQAYAYLFYDPDKRLSEQAFKRLEAISEFTELGSGFQIAMKDLEIRGSGNLLGSEQHGFICQIGFELYCQLLSDAVEELKGQKKDLIIPTIFEISVDAYIPDDYISHKKQKLAFYKRISSVTDYTALSDISSELEDRFGKLPLVVKNLINIARLKILATQKQIERIKAKKPQIIFTFFITPDISKKKMKETAKDMEGILYFNADGQLVLNKEWKTPQEILELIEELIVFLL